VTEKILFVDDEPNVLDSIRRGLRKKYEVETALSGAEALECLAVKGPFAVIVSDMQMPNMNGAQLLAKAKLAAPETVRIMLTGNADQQTAIDAINEGDILRFLTKPASNDQIVAALEAGLKQHRLIVAEREILDNTLRGSIQAMSEILSLANPEIFGRTIRIRNRLLQVASVLGIEDTWEMETAALLSQIGCISVPVDIMKRKISGSRLQPDEDDQYLAHTVAGADILTRIPRMEGVARAIRYQEKAYNGEGFPADNMDGDDIPMAARILKVLLDLDNCVASGLSEVAALAHLRKQTELYDPKVLDALKSVLSHDDEWEMVSLPLTRLKVDMLIATDIYTESGTLLVSKGQTVTKAVTRHLRNYEANGQIKSTVDVWCQPDSQAA
jgi:response regulator RpfG family c-di-GMP phosphodiesterase